MKQPACLKDLMQDIQRYIRYALSIALTAVFLLHVGGKITVPAFSAMENQAYDARLNLTLPPKQENQVVVIDIDEKSLGEIGQWPWNRDVMSNIIDNLFDHYKIKTIGFDIVFAEADVDEGGKLLQKMSEGPLKDNELFQQEYNNIKPSLQRDKTFAKSLENRKTIMGIVFRNDVDADVKNLLPEPVARLDNTMKDRIEFFKPNGYTANLPMLQKSAYSGGFFDNPALDDDGVFRSVPLIQEYDGQLHESLAMALTRAALGSPKIELIVETSTDSKKIYFWNG